MDYKYYTDLAMQCLHMAGNEDYIGEPVSQLQHALQSAYFAEQSGHAEEVILASLFHDIGHFAATTPQFKMANLGIIHHEWIGAKLIYEMGFSQQVALLIGYHVDAKRYLARKKENYYVRLSAASQQTLTFQGGVMSDQELKQFSGHRYHKEILQVRINDEKAKKDGLQVPDLSYYRPLIENHMKKNKNITTAGDQCVLTAFIDDTWVKRLREWMDPGY